MSGTKESPFLSRGSVLSLIAWVVVALAAWGLWKSVPRSPRGTRDQAQMKALEIALKAYLVHYNGCLLAATGAPAKADIEVAHRILSPLIADSSEFNPEMIRFLDPTTARSEKGGAWKDASGHWQLRDEWGTVFRMRFSGIDEQPSPRDPSDVLSAKYILWSAGPDRDFSTWEDNVTSWK